MRSWDSLTIAEQTLMRRAISGNSLAGTVQGYGAALRWSGSRDAPPLRSYTQAEQRALVPQLAAAALNLNAHGLLSLHEAQEPTTAGKRLLAEPELHEVLTEPAHWLWTSNPARRFNLTAPQPVRAHWFDSAYPTADTSGLPTWDELSIAQRKILVCAAEASGMLTGAFGIWDDPPTDLDQAERLTWVDRQLAALIPFVRNGWIEVHHYPDPASDAITVIPLYDLRSALADPAIRHEGDDDGEMFVGVGCTFTHAGHAVWRGAWSNAWSKRLNFD